MAHTHPLVITLDTAPASDGWGFVGRLLVGELEAYRTLRAYPTPTEARAATEAIVGRVLGAILAGEEWRSLTATTRHAARRADLNFGLPEVPSTDVTAPSPATDAPDHPG
jgi:hypothetical protein